MASDPETPRPAIVPKVTKSSAGPHVPEAHPDQLEHQGATEDQVTETTAPAGSEFEDEPKQG